MDFWKKVIQWINGILSKKSTIWIIAALLVLHICFAVYLILNGRSNANDNTEAYVQGDQTANRTVNTTPDQIPASSTEGTGTDLTETTTPAPTVINGTAGASVTPKEDREASTDKENDKVAYPTQKGVEGSNSISLPVKEEYIKFSHAAGVYKVPFQLTLSKNDNETSVYYTLDGSAPTEEDHLYNGPILVKDRSPEENLYVNHPDISYYYLKRGMEIPNAPVSKGTVIRAQAFKNGEPVGEVYTRTFFVFEQGAQRYTYPIVSLVIEPYDLFDHEKGIYVLGDIFANWRSTHKRSPLDYEIPANYMQSGIEWERDVSVEYFDHSGKMLLSQNAGVRVMGAASRADPIKSLKLFARKEYNESGKFENVFFDHLLDQDGDEINKLKRVALRNHGNDWETALMRGVLLQSLMEGTRVDVQESEPVIVFINGEYWGINFITEVMDQYYIEEHYNVPDEEVVIIQYQYGVQVDEGVEEDINYYNDMINFIETHDLSQDENYKIVEKQIDIDNYIAYNLAEIYYANTDWPGNNVRMWRKRTEPTDAKVPYGHDGKWRWMLYDTDFGFGMMSEYSYVSHDTMSFAADPSRGNIKWPNPEWSTFLFRSLVKNEGFQKKFVEKADDFLNTRFEPNHVKEKINYFQALLAPEINEYAARFDNKLNRSPDAWLNEVEFLRNFAEQRAAYVKGFIRDYFIYQKLGKK